MEKEILKYLGRRAVMTYQDRDGQFSQLHVLLQSNQDGRLHAFDTDKKAPRVFVIDNILAVLPVMRHAG